METSLRYGGDTKSLRIHAKEKFPIGANVLCQINGELDTRIGAPSCVHAMIRYFYPELPASFGVGIQYDRAYGVNKAQYKIRGKKAFPVTSDELMSFNIKGGCHIDEKFRKIKYDGAAEFVWNIFDVKKDQDFRLKFGYNVTMKTPYWQIRENNWTFNLHGDRRWNVRYNL